jgi:predicted TIM-barrel fold metal-dependent hydrolase
MSQPITDGPIIDAHHHIWRLAKLPWLAGPPVPRIFGEYGPLRRDYTVDEFMRDVTAAGVVKSVYVQVNVPSGEEVEEVEWVQSVGNAHGFPHGITGYADLASPDVAAVLDRELASRNLRGIRQQLHWHEKPLYKFAPRPDVMNDAAWRRGLREVEKRGLLFELQVFTSQMADAASLARDFPKTQFVLLHAGMLADRSPAGWAAWRQGMRELAGCPNVAVKLSGLGTFDRECSVALWRPIVEETLEMFGAGRCLFGSNFPIESLWTTYAALIAVMRECLSGLSSADRRAVWHDNAARLYQL